MATFVHSMLQSFAFKAPLSLRISVPPTAFTTTSSCSTQHQQQQPQQQSVAPSRIIVMTSTIKEHIGASAPYILNTFYKGEEP
jgi:hypothetical protein